jgi:PKD repeat protein
MNWGWSGFDNGYFAINNLTTTGDFNPIEDDDALIGIVPQYPLAPITDFLANYTSICSGTVQFIDISQDVPTSWAWNFGDNTTSTLQSPSHTYAVSGTYTVTLTATNPAGSTAKTITNYITINLLSPPTVSNVSSVEPASFSLTANTTDSVNWFDTQGNLLSTDNPFVTPVLNTTTTYYVENSVANPSYSVGPVCHAPAKGAYLTDPNALRFNVLKPCIIVSVYMNSKTSANRTVQVKDTMGYVVAQQTVYCPAGGAQAVVNLSINTGGSYYMSVADTLGLFSDTTGAAYPYTDSGGIVSITGLDSAIYSTYPRAYFYFYNWVVKEPDCASQRVPLVASILSTGINEVSADMSFTLYPNPATNDVVLQTNQTGNGTVYTVKNILGQTLLSGNVEAAQTHIDLSAFANGIYLIELNQGEQTAVKKLVINK